jgi:hypothetical protein
MRWGKNDGKGSVWMKMEKRSGGKRRERRKGREEMAQNHPNIISLLFFPNSIRSKMWGSTRVIRSPMPPDVGGVGGGGPGFPSPSPPTT